MTRKDFEFIAEVLGEEIAALREDGADTSAYVVARVARTFARRLENLNPSFNRARFLAACGVEG